MINLSDNIIIIIIFINLSFYFDPVINLPDNIIIIIIIIITAVTAASSSIISKRIGQTSTCSLCH